MSMWQKKSERRSMSSEASQSSTDWGYTSYNNFTANGKTGQQRSSSNNKYNNNNNSLDESYEEDFSSSSYSSKKSYSSNNKVALSTLK